MSLDRRDFLKVAAGAVAVSSCLSFSHVGVWADAQGAAGRDAGADYPLNPLHPWVNDYTLPSGDFVGHRAQTLRYDWVFWDWKGRPKAPPKGTVFGSVVIERRPSGSGVEYQINQLRDSRRMTAKVSCQADEVESVNRWSLEETYPVEERHGAEAHAAKASGKFTSRTEGRCEGGRAYVSRFGQQQVIPLDGPLVCSWALMANPTIAASLCRPEKKFTLADQMSVLRAGDQGRRDVDVSVGGASCSTFLLTGPGSPPTHVIIHPRIGSLCVTIYHTSVVLSSISNAD